MRKAAKLLLSAWLCTLCTPGRAASGEIEYKLLIDPASWGAVTASYGLSNSGKERDIYFYDTPNLALYNAGLVLRARAGSKKGDSTVKYRPWNGPEPAEMYAYEGFKCETDAGLDGSAMSCSLTAPRDPADIADVASGERKPRHLYTDAQRAWTGDNMWENVRPLGPIRSSAWETPHPSVGEISFERWDLPGGPSYCEVSFRSDPRSGLAKFNALQKELSHFGIKLAARQGAKTKAAMQFFAGR